MARAVLQQERDLHVLKRSNLQGYKEFYVMYKDVEEYHYQLKSDILNGRKEAKRELDMRPYLYDTGDNHDKKFYGILIRMLLEVHGYKDKDKQQEDLQKIFSWYRANKQFSSDKNIKERNDVNVSNRESSAKGSRRRPMSCLDNTTRSGVLRYTYAPETSNSPKSPRKRAVTAKPRLGGHQGLFGADGLLDEVSTSQGSSGSSPHGILSVRCASPLSARKQHARPGTAPATLLEDFEKLARQICEGVSNNTDLNENEKDSEKRHVSRVSVQYLDEKQKLLKGRGSPLVYQGAQDLGEAAKEGDRSHSISKVTWDENSNEEVEPHEEQKGRHRSFAEEPADLEIGNGLEGNQMNGAASDNDATRIKKKSLQLNGDVGARLILEMATPVGKKIAQLKESRSVESIPVIARRTQTDRSNTAASCESLQPVSEVNVSLTEMAKPYDVHFSHDLKLDHARHYRTSGPVEPESNRYRWKDDGNGGRTFVKRISKNDLFSKETITRRNSKKSITNPTCIRMSSHKRILDPKAVASMLVIKHLGVVDRNTSERQGETKPIWIEDQHDYKLNSEYLAFTKGLELKYNNKMKESTRGYGQQGKVKLPYLHYKDKPRDALNNGDEMRRFGIENDGDLPDTDEIVRRIIEENKSAAAVAEEEQRLTAAKAASSTESSLSEARGRALRLAPKPPAGSVTHNRSPSPRPRTRVPSEETPVAPPPPKKELTFDVSHFHHFCFDDNPNLDMEYKLQMEANAAVSIQRIFRGHMARQYMKQLKLAEKERQRKAAVSLQSAMRGYWTRKRLIEENVKYREPTVTTVEWAREYKIEHRKKEQERKQKLQAKARKDYKMKSTHEETMKGIKATDHIYDLFHDKTPSKAQMKAAAITIQRYVRGWLVRRFLEKSKTKALKRSLDFKGFINTYRDHLTKIMKRHGSNATVVLKFNELLQYIEKRNKYEVEFDRLAGKTSTISYKDMKQFFEACSTCPSTKEVNDAIRAVLSFEEPEQRKEHKYKKMEVVDIAFHIFVPKGTKLKGTRKSTWMNPLLGVDEKTKLALSKKVLQQTDFDLVFRLVSSAKEERDEMERRAINPELLPEDATREGFQDVTGASKSKPNKEKVKRKTKK